MTGNADVRPGGLTDPVDLDDSDVSEYQHRGWAYLPGLIPEDLATALRDAVLAAGPSADDAYQQRSTVQFQGTRNAEVAAIRAREHRVYAELDAISPLFRDVVTSPRLIWLAKQLLGGETVQFYRAAVLVKPASRDGGLETMFHQDLPVLPFDRSGSLMIWIALGRVTADMGPVQFIEGSHRQYPLLGRTNGRAEEQVRLQKILGDYRLTEPPVLESGDATIHDDMTMHCAGINNSDGPRIALTVKYMRPDILYTGAPHHVTNGRGLTINERFPGEEFPES
jgi:ectoine hydroxylase-related dioxygenase (phytanoyl-CoA dioxygenase family)